MFCSDDEIQWKDLDEEVRVESFTAPVGPAVPIPASILETFQLFTSAMMSMIVEQTNTYAGLVLGESASTKWIEVTEQDIWAFLGFTILMGINVLPALAHYWRKNKIFHYFPIADRISRDRFVEILRFLHFVDNTSLPDRADPGYH